MCAVDFQVQRITVCYWKRERPTAYGSLDEGHPCFIKCDPYVAGLPAMEYPKHVKVGYVMATDVMVTVINFDHSDNNDQLCSSLRRRHKPARRHLSIVFNINQNDP